jgi:DNA-binding GntR family transcriptional regulator
MSGFARIEGALGTACDNSWQLFAPPTQTPSLKRTCQKMKQITEVTGALRDAIISGQLMPNERLIEASLADRLGATRALVRRALAALESEGLVVSEANRGARVRRITAAEAIEITEARGALEALIAAKAAERANGDDIGRLEEILKIMRAAQENEDLMRYSSLNRTLDAELSRIAQHKLVSDMLLRLNSQIVRFQFSVILLPGRAAQSIGEHAKIVAAIKAADPAAARTAVEEHFSNSIAALKRVISVQEGAAGSAHLPFDFARRA